MVYMRTFISISALTVSTYKYIPDIHLRAGEKYLFIIYDVESKTQNDVKIIWYTVVELGGQKVRSAIIFGERGMKNGNEA